VCLLTAGPWVASLSLASLNTCYLTPCLLTSRLHNPTESLSNSTEGFKLERSCMCECGPEAYGRSACSNHEPCKPGKMTMIKGPAQCSATQWHEAYRAVNNNIGSRNNWI